MPRMLLPRRDQLRWQLAVSHIIATAVTLVSMIATAVLIITLVFSRRAGAATSPAGDARLIASATGPMLEEGNTALLNGVLTELAAGRLRLQLRLRQFGPPDERGQIDDSTALDGVAFIAIFGADGRVVAGSGPAGAALNPPGEQLWRPLVERALAGDTNLDRLMLLRDTSPAAFGAYPVRAESGTRTGAVLIAFNQRPAPSGGLSFPEALALFGVATIGVLSVSSIFALGSATAVAYLLSRRLVRRLERLGEAADALAAGDLAARVEEGRPDEVGRLARRFNGMAADLARTLHELEGERDRVSALLEARRQLVASVSHELRTPVATVRGYLESALHGGEPLPERLQADLDVIDREIQRLQRMIDDLFTLARAQVGRLELRIGSVDAGSVVQRLAATAAPLAWRSRQVQVVAETGEGLPPVRADAQRLEQIVSNLLSNAVRHTPPGGIVAIAAAAEDACVRIEVQDTGAGIEPDVLPHIFERFVRGGEGGSDGAGLGLALVKDLVDAMQGSVEASSTPGEGSRFIVRLPLA